MPIAIAPVAEIRGRRDRDQSHNGTNHGPDRRRTPSLTPFQVVQAIMAEAAASVVVMTAMAVSSAANADPPLNPTSQTKATHRQAEQTEHCAAVLPHLGCFAVPT